MKSRYSRIFATLLGLAALMIPAAALAATTVTVWSWRTDDIKAYNQMFAAFEKDHPDIKVDFVATKDSEYETRLGTALRANRGPDIAQLKPYGELQPLVDAGYLVKLDGKIPALSNFYPNALDGARSIKDNGVYGVPYSLVNMGVFYNKAMFAKYNISIPKTYDEFVAACKTLKAAGIAPIAIGGANGSGWELELGLGVVGPNTYGGNAFWTDIMSGKAKFTDPRYVAAIQKMVDLAPYYEPGFKGMSYDTAISEFINGQAAMFFGGSFENGNIRTQNPKLQYSIFPFPPDKAGGTDWVSAFADGSYGLVAQSHHQKEALEVLQFMASKQFATMFADLLGWPPAEPGVTAQDPVLDEMLKMQAHTTPYLTLVGTRWQAPTGSSVMQAELGSVMAGDETPMTLAEHLQTAVSSWFKPDVYSKFFKLNQQ